MNEVILNKLVRRATPFLRINGATPMAWRRNVKSGGRAGPWRYKAHYSVISEPTWRRTGEVIYFVTDGTQRLRLVGQSSRRLMDRWRVSPMHDVLTCSHLDKRRYFTAARGLQSSVALTRSGAPSLSVHFSGKTWSRSVETSAVPSQSRSTRQKRAPDSSAITSKLGCAGCRDQGLIFGTAKRRDLPLTLGKRHDRGV